MRSPEQTMPVFLLREDPIFPPPHLAEPSGLLAVGGDLSLSRLVRAYSMGIFPWYDEDSPILWWSPDPRPVLFPDKLRVSRRLARTLRQARFRITLDRDFAGVIRGCAGVCRKEERGAWIIPEMIAAYETLHAAGLAHSAEAWLDGELVGGLYGVALGRMFFGESMFHLATDASKVALVHLAGFLGRHGFACIDCQQATGHMLRFGAEELPRDRFLALLGRASRRGSLPGPWDIASGAELV